MKRSALIISGIFSALLLLASCGQKEGSPSTTASAADFNVCMSSENASFAQDLKDVASANRKSLKVTAVGTIDLMNDLSANGKATSCDAFWVSSSDLLRRGDRQKVVKDADSIAWSPVVPIIRRDVAESKGWLNGRFTYKQFFTSVVAGELPFAMTNPGQSYSGQSGYVAFLQVLANKDDPITASDLDSKPLQAATKKVLGGINRSSTSSGFLKDLVVAEPQKFAAMVNYEAMALEANQALAAQGISYCALIPEEGTSIADFPFGYVDKGDAGKRALFDALKSQLQSEAFKAKLTASGRRVGLGMFAAAKPTLDPCFDTSRQVRIMATPSPDVIELALALYQEDLRRPTDLYFVADYSPSMGGNGGEVALKNSMKLLFDPESAKRLKLQHHPQDRSTFIPFDNGVMGKFVLNGNDQTLMKQFLSSILNTGLGSGTNIYAGLDLALDLVVAAKPDDTAKNRRVAIIVMTDGQSDSGMAERVRAKYASIGVPVYSIAFSGEADLTQLRGLASWQTSDKGLAEKLVCSSKNENELVACFRRIRGETS